jgi:DNA-binding GntR family transcriptional regulator
MPETAYPFDDGVTVQRRGLRDDVYALVLDMLMGSSIAPGTRLSIDGIARHLGVSPTPVREALIQLERTGLVTREALKGYRVAPPMTPTQLDALFDARLVLEVGTVELATRDATAVLPRLEAALKEHERVAYEIRRAAEDQPLPMDALRSYFAADWAFHQVFFDATKNPFLLDMSEAISTRAHRMRQTVSSGVTDAADAVKEHTAIVEAFRSGNAREAAQAMRSHLDKVRVRALADAAGTVDS